MENKNINKANNKNRAKNNNKVLNKKKATNSNKNVSTSGSKKNNVSKTTNNKNFTSSKGVKTTKKNINKNIKQSNNNLKNKVNEKDLIQKKKIEKKDKLIETTYLNNGTIQNNTVPVKMDEQNTTTKIEASKFTIVKKEKKLLFIGIFISILGLIALILSLLANRIIDKEFLSDSIIILMIFISLMIECLGTFIIINET